ncbi:UNKNOWN [Stylonychia lemnae]|uniref:Uncharacterized protein n=1 Tax=Stylonychia lemnae TaxID=5949 RepID=A0A077ZYB9_STYLE|nr:UNKNOWN [Stylonychia lemnae]|eukprot:CDW74911.1 UNKNOWN [Stylonychia lemnae]
MSKLNSLRPFLFTEIQKSGIIQILGEDLTQVNKYLDIPIVNNYKFLGSFISPYRYLIIESSLQNMITYQQKLCRAIKRLSVQESINIIQSFILGQLMIKFLPIYMVGYIKLDQMQTIYQDNLKRALIQLKINDNNLKFEKHSLQRFDFLLANFEPNLDQMALNDESSMNLIQNQMFKFKDIQLSKYHIKVLNLQTSIWLINEMCVRCKDHNQPLGRGHLCDAELVSLRVPFLVKDIFNLNEIQAAILIEKVYIRLKEIGKFEYYRVDNLEEQYKNIIIEVIDFYRKKTATKYRKKQHNPNQNNFIKIF